MRKAEKKRADAEPTVPYEEDYAQVFEVENRLKAVRKALERMVVPKASPVGPQGVLANLTKLEKRLTDITGCRC